MSNIFTQLCIIKLFIHNLTQKGINSFNLHEFLTSYYLPEVQRRLVHHVVPVHYLALPGQCPEILGILLNNFAHIQQLVFCRCQ